MAGDWIKIRTDLVDDPRVLKMAGKMNTTPHQIVGMLVALWAWADRHSVDGQALGVNDPMIDSLAGGAHGQGLASALRHVGWLDGEQWALRLPNFKEHNGTTAKKRLINAKRVAAWRDNEEALPETLPEALPEASPEALQEALQRVLQERDLEKRREDLENIINKLGKKQTPAVPAGSGLPKTPTGASATPTAARGSKKRKGSRVQENSPLMIRINAWFRRKPTTLWTLEEEEAMKANGELDPDDLDVLEAHYREKIPPKNDYRRRSVETLMNNFSESVDRARRFMSVLATCEEETGANEGF